MKLPASIFRAYDIRGVVGKTLTEEAAFLIGKAIGEEAREKGEQTIAVGRDGRLSSPTLASALSEGLMKAGLEVFDIGLVPTPVLYFATFHLPTRSGVMVTGSHNPPDYNGFKIVIQGETLAQEGIQRIKWRVEDPLPDGRGKLTEMDILPDYLKGIQEKVRLERPFKVAVDCGNGAAGVVAPGLFERLGCEVFPLFCEVDGRFPNHHPDPSQPENLRDLITLIRERQADIGFAFDGDGDRLGVVDGEGNILWPDRQLMLFARDVLRRFPGATVLFDVKCSALLPRDIETHGGRPIMGKTGHSLIKAAMKETGAVLAGEMSGHLFFKEWFGFDDAIYAAARMLAILSEDPRPPAKVFRELPQTVNTPEIRVEMAEGTHHAFMVRLLKEAPAWVQKRFPEARIITLDGLRIDLPGGFGLVRASNTTPCLVLRFEAMTEEDLDHIRGAFRELLKSLDPNLTLPF